MKTARACLCQVLVKVFESVSGRNNSCWGIVIGAFGTCCWLIIWLVLFRKWNPNLEEVWRSFLLADWLETQLLDEWVWLNSTTHQLLPVNLMISLQSVDPQVPARVPDVPEASGHPSQTLILIELVLSTHFIAFTSLWPCSYFPDAGLDGMFLGTFPSSGTLPVSGCLRIGSWLPISYLWATKS